MSRRKTKSIIAAASLTLAGVFATTAFAADYTSKVKINEGPPAFHGKVTSPKDDCIELRKVKVYKEKNSGNKLKGKDNTDMNGKWEVPVNLKSGAYFAKVTERKEGNVTCLKAKSKVITVD